MADDPSWQPLDTSVLRERLAHVRDLLRQAAAVALAQDVERLESFGETAAKEDRGNRHRRRYR